MVFFQQIVGAVVYPEVLRDAFALYVCAVPVKVYHGLLEIAHCHAVAAERSRAAAVCLLELLQICFVKDECLEFIPGSLEQDFHPAVKNLLRR